MTEMQRPLEELEQTDAFVARHIGPRAADKQAMLATLGLGSMDELVDKVVPSAIRAQAPLALDEGCTESEALDRLRALADRNKVYKSYIGMGRAATGRAAAGWLGGDPARHCGAPVCLARAAL